MTDLCLAAAGIVVRLAAAEFTLAWAHSVERVRWEEDWRVEGDRLVAVESRVRGSGAGMEPPDDAVLAGGSWHYRPRLPPQERLQLARSGVVADWQLCLAGTCRDLAAYLPAAVPIDAAATLEPCPG